MGKIKQYIVESKARKELGSEKYYALRQEFLNVFHSVCSSFVGDSEGRKIVRELKELKDKMWLDNLFKFLGSATLVVSLWRSDMYSVRETIAGCVVGTIMATVAQLKSMYASRSYDEKKEDLIDYVTTKIESQNGAKLAEGYEGKKDTLNVIYKDACDDLVY